MTTDQAQWETATSSTVADRTRSVKVVATGVCVTFPVRHGEVHALGPFDLTMEEGEFVCLVGPSGCGKSTFLRVLAGLIEPTAGSITLRHSRPSSTLTASVFQDYGIFPWKTVTANVAFGLESQGVARKAARRTATEWLERLGLSGFGDQYPNTLSGGMRQRVAIARALAMEPEILLMDEPFAALDAQMREVLQEELLQICQADKRTVLFVTHSLEEALVLGDTVVVMSARPGKLLHSAHVPFPRPRDASVRESPDFPHARRELWDHLRSQVELQRKPMHIDADADAETEGGERWSQR